jgi:nucleoid DNA-binding protein
MTEATRFDRELFADYIHKKLKKEIALHHIVAVLTILLDEMVIELKRGQEVIVKNFGTFVLKTLKDREHHNVRTGERMISPGKKVLRLKMPRKITLYLLRRLDIDKTFGPPHIERDPTTTKENG